MKMLLLLTSMALVATQASAARIKDISQVAETRANQLVGYGLVTGLPGTGRSFLSQIKFNAVLENFGISFQRCQPKSKNVAAVIIPELAAFAKQGQTIDVTITSIGAAKSLRGGTLMLQTMLKGVDGQVYAVAQENLVVSGFSATGADGSKIVGNNPTTEYDIKWSYSRTGNPLHLAVVIISPLTLLESNFTTAQRMADAVNNFLGPQMAQPIDATSVKVRAPRDISQRVSFLSAIENLEFDPAEGSAKIIVNSRTGTIVVGKHVLKPAAVTRSGMTVAIKKRILMSVSPMHLVVERQSLRQTQISK